MSHSLGLCVELAPPVCLTCDACGKCNDLCTRDYGDQACQCPLPVCTGCTSTTIRDDCPIGAHRYQAAIDATARRRPRRRS